MDASRVARLAEQERDNWRIGGTFAQPRISGGSGPGAYLPLDSPTASTQTSTEPPPMVKFIDVQAIGTTLIFGFRWPPDKRRRDILLAVDFRDYPGDEIGASTWLLEYIEQRIHHDTSWFPGALTEISKSVAFLRPVRHPGDNGNQGVGSLPVQ